MTLLFLGFKFGGVLSALGQLGVLGQLVAVDFGLRRGVSAVCNARTIFYFAGISGNLWLLTRQKGEFFLLRIFRIRAILFLC